MNRKEIFKIWNNKLIDLLSVDFTYDTLEPKMYFESGIPVLEEIDINLWNQLFPLINRIDTYREGKNVT